MRSAAGSRFTALPRRARKVRRLRQIGPAAGGKRVGRQPRDQRGLARGRFGRALAKRARAGQARQETGRSA